MQSASTEPPSGASEVLREIDLLVAELAELARSEIQPREFYAHLLQRTMFVLSADGAALWSLAAARQLQLAFRQGMEQLETRQGGAAYECELARLKPLVAAPRAALLPSDPSSGVAAWAVVAPVLLGEQVSGLLAVYFKAEMPQAVKQGFQRFVSELAEISASYEQRRQLAAWREQQSQWSGFAEFALAAQRGWSLREVAFEIANEGRRYLKCDRLSVAICSGRRVKLLAVSGVDAVQKHANLVRKLERLVKAVIRTRQPFIYDDADAGQQSSELPPQIETLLKSYLDEGAARSLAITPLFPPEKSDGSRGAPLGATVCEQFRSHSLAIPIEQLQSLNQHASLALSRAQRIRGVPLLGFLAQHSRVFSLFRLQMWPIWTLAAACVAAIVAALTLVQADFDIVVRGEFQPVEQRHVFASYDGAVDEVFVKHDQQVQAGELVAELSSSALDMEFQRVVGEMGVVQTELSALRTEQLQATDFDEKTADKLQQLSSRELALDKRLENLTAQLELLTEQREQLKLTSPIDGRVLTWDVQGNILARPVGRGDILVTIANTAGAWVARFHAPDEATGHILAAQADSDEPLAVSFVSIADPAATYSGVVEQIAKTSQVDAATRASGVLLDVAFDKSLVPQLRTGAAVVGKVHCGRRAIGYVWLHEFLEEIDRRFF